MDQRSFEEGILIGLETAAVVLKNHPAQARLVKLEVINTRSLVERRRIGEAPPPYPRKMVKHDIFLERPLMTAADIGWPA